MILRSSQSTLLFLRRWHFRQVWFLWRAGQHRPQSCAGQCFDFREWIQLGLHKLHLKAKREKVLMHTNDTHLNVVSFLQQSDWLRTFIYLFIFSNKFLPAVTSIPAAPAPDPTEQPQTRIDYITQDSNQCRQTSTHSISGLLIGCSCRQFKRTLAFTCTSQSNSSPQPCAWWHRAVCSYVWLFVFWLFSGFRCTNLCSVCTDSLIATPLPESFSKNSDTPLHLPASSCPHIGPLNDWFLLCARTTFALRLKLTLLNLCINICIHFGWYSSAVQCCVYSSSVSRMGSRSTCPDTVVTEDEWLNIQLWWSPLKVVSSFDLHSCIY